MDENEKRIKIKKLEKYKNLKEEKAVQVDASMVVVFSFAIVAFISILFTKDKFVPFSECESLKQTFFNIALRFFVGSVVALPFSPLPYMMEYISEKVQYDFKIKEIEEELKEYEEYANTKKLSK